MEIKEIDWNRLTEEPSYAAEVCKINLQYLDEALENQPSLYAYVAAQYEACKIQEIRAKTIVDRTRALTYQAMIASDPKIAVAKAEKLITADSSVIQATDAHTETRARTGAMRAVVSGFEHRRDMLIQISSRQKAEARHY